MRTHFKQLISHKPPRHADDYFAIAFAYQLLQIDEKPLYIAPQGDEIKKYINHNLASNLSVMAIPLKNINDKYLIVDVGGLYYKNEGLFDHHQDMMLRCSFYMLLEYLTESKINGLIKTKLNLNYILHSNIVDKIDYIDRNGYPNFVKKYPEEAKMEQKEMDIPFIGKRMINNREANQFLLSLEPSRDDVSKIIVNNFEDAIDYAYNSLNTFYLYLFEKLISDKDIGEEIGNNILSIEKEKERFFETGKSINIDEFNIFYNPEMPAKYIGEVYAKGYNVVISKNTQNPNHTSININNTITNRANVDKLKEKYDIVFAAPAKFIIVVDKPADDVDVEEIIKLLFY